MSPWILIILGLCRQPEPFSEHFAINQICKGSIYEEFASSGTLVADIKANHKGSSVVIFHEGKEYQFVIQPAPEPVVKEK